MVRVLSQKAVMIKMSTSNTPHIQYKIYREHSSHSIQDLQGTLLTFNTRSTGDIPQIRYKIYKEHSSSSIQNAHGIHLFAHCAHKCKLVNAVITQTTYAVW